MFSKIEVDPAKRSGPRAKLGFSIAVRMTGWYALTSFAMVFVATGLLYWVLSASLYEEDVRDLADNLNNARLLFGGLSQSLHPPSFDERPGWAPAHQPEIYLRVLDQNGRVIVETPHMSDELSPPGKAELAAIRSPEGEKRDLVDTAGQPFLSLIVPIAAQNTSDVPAYMQVAMDREHDEELLSRYRARLWIVLTTSLFFCSVGGYLVARSGMRPIENIGRTAERIRSTTLHERIELGGLPSEISGLASTFNAMLDRLEDSFERVSHFSDDVAHELRTPVNNLRGEIEVALCRSRSGENYRDILGSCLEECERISRLIQSLLFLARIENAADQLQIEIIHLKHELEKVLEFYGVMAADAGIALELLCDEARAMAVDRTLFQQVIGNLVSNAIAHTSIGGKVQISVSGDPNSLVILVTDTGCGIAPEHLPRIFDRFYRADRVRSGASHHLGLGLAVVKSIVSRHGGRLEVDSVVGHGTSVRITLPITA